MPDETNFLEMNKHLHEPHKLVEIIRNFPTEVDFMHCGVSQRLSPFAIYGKCEKCGIKVKLWSFTASTEVHDVFDAFFEWLLKDGAAEVARKRQAEILSDSQNNDAPAK